MMRIYRYTCPASLYQRNSFKLLAVYRIRYDLLKVALTLADSVPMKSCALPV